MFKEMSLKVRQNWATPLRLFVHRQNFCFVVGESKKSLSVAFAKDGQRLRNMQRFARRCAVIATANCSAGLRRQSSGQRGPARLGSSVIDHRSSIMGDARERKMTTKVHGDEGLGFMNCWWTGQKCSGDGLEANFIARRFGHLKSARRKPAGCDPSWGQSWQTAIVRSAMLGPMRVKSNFSGSMPGCETVSKVPHVSRSSFAPAQKAHR